MGDLANMQRDNAAQADGEGTTPHEIRRAHILQAARACFSRGGFHSTSMQAVCAEARMSPGALYRYFPSKDALIEAIAIEERRKGLAISDLLGGGGSIHQRLLASGIAYINSMRDRGEVLLMLEVFAESIRSSAVHLPFAACAEESMALFCAAVVEAQQRGEIAADIDAIRAVQTLRAFADGIVLRVGVDPTFEVDSCTPMLWRVVTAVLGEAPETMDVALENIRALPICRREP